MREVQSRGEERRGESEKSWKERQGSISSLVRWSLPKNFEFLLDVKK